MAAALLVAAAGPGADVRVSIIGMRSARGQILACLTTRPAAFPDCTNDPASHKLSLPVTSPMELDFGPVAAGRYAISLIHDENGNGKLDTRIGMPREGYGFSRDAAVRFGPPRFSAAAFAVGEAPVHQTIHIRYIF